MVEPKKDFPIQSKSNISHSMSHSLSLKLRLQVYSNHYESDSFINSSAEDNPPPLHTDYCSQDQYTTDSHDYLQHITKTIESALTDKPDHKTGDHIYELTRLIDNPYSGLVFFDDQTDEQEIKVSLLHHAAFSDNCEAINELSEFYAPPANHHKYIENPYTNHNLAFRLLLKSSELGSAEASERLHKIYTGCSHIKTVDPSDHIADSYLKLKEGQSVSEKSLKSSKTEENIAIKHEKAKKWYFKEIGYLTVFPPKHNPPSSINKFYERAERDTNNSLKYAIDYLKAQTINRRNYQESGTERAEAMFDLGMIFKQNKELDTHSEAGALLNTASHYDKNIGNEINIILSAETKQHEPEQIKKKLSSPRMG